MGGLPVTTIAKPLINESVNIKFENSLKLLRKTLLWVLMTEIRARKMQ